MDTIQSVQGASLDELENQLKESQRIYGKMKQNLQGEILQNLISGKLTILSLVAGLLKLFQIPNIRIPIRVSIFKNGYHNFVNGRCNSIVILTCDNDGDEILSEGEIEDLIHKIEGIQGVDLNDELIRRKIVESGASLNGTLPTFVHYGHYLAKCPLQFSLGVSHRTHSTARNPESMGIVQPPVIYPIMPSKGPGRQVLYTTQYEHLDLLTPATKSQILAEAPKTAATASATGMKSSTTSGKNAVADGSTSSAAISRSSTNLIKEGLVQTQHYPLLFESSFFLTAPVLHDVNGDGITDAILTDYDGGVYIVGLQNGKHDEHGRLVPRRYFHRAQVPRLYVRRTWLEARLNETLPEEERQKQETSENNGESGEEGDPADHMRHHEPNDPYHSYFEYSYGGTNSNENKESILRGVTANVLGQDHEEVKALEERRKRSSLVSKKKIDENEVAQEEEESESDNHRRPQRTSVDDGLP